MIAKLLLLPLVGAVAAIDLATKAWALTLPVQGVPVLPFLSLRLSFNTGVSFGLFAAEGVHGYAILLATTLAISMLFLWLAWRADRALEQAGDGMIVGGAMGNVLDRLPDGIVTDFLDLHVAGWHFPTFNLADVAITMGAAMLVLGTIRRPDHDQARTVDTDRRLRAQRTIRRR